MTRLDVHDLERLHWAAQESAFHAGAMARILKISQRHMQRCIKDAFGCTPQEWLDERRLSLSLTLLQARREVNTVAYLLGFEQPSHFSRRFKRRFGISPKAFLGADKPHDAGWRREDIFGGALTERGRTGTGPGWTAPAKRQKEIVALSAILSVRMEPPGLLTRAWQRY